eukprot:6185850-Pleurochrysis_carterae.AAC.2
MKSSAFGVHYNDCGEGAPQALIEWELTTTLMPTRLLWWSSAKRPVTETLLGGRCIALSI